MLAFAIKSFALRTLALTLCVTFSLAVALRADEGIKWTAELDEAIKLSQRYHVPVLVHFSSDHCPPCRLLEQRAFKSNDVIKAVHDDYIPVLVNVDQYRQVAQKYKVEQWPTDILLNSDGQIMHKGVSPQDPNQYVAMLKKGVTSHRNHLALKIEAAKTADPALVAKSQIPAARTPTAQTSVAGTPNSFSLAGTQTNLQSSSSVASRVTAAPELQAEAADSSSNATPQVATTSIQTANPFYKPTTTPSVVSSADTAKSIVDSETDMPKDSTVSAQPAEEVVVASPDTEEKESVCPPVLDGFCPVTLHEALVSGSPENAWVEGAPEFAVKHRSCIYWFKDEAQLEKFMADPDKYAAVLSGYDLVTFLREGVLLPGKREHGYIREGKLFLFSSEANKKQFAERHHEYVAELQQLLMSREAKKVSGSTTVTR